MPSSIKAAIFTVIMVAISIAVLSRIPRVWPILVGFRG